MSRQVIFLLVALLMATLANAEPEKALPLQKFDAIVGANEAMADDLNALFQSSRTEADAAQDAMHVAEDAMDLDVAGAANSVGGVGPQESMVLDDPSPLPAAHKPNDLQRQINQLKQDLRTQMSRTHKVNEKTHSQPIDDAVSTMVDDPCHSKYTTQASCDADKTTGGGCTWCECAAVPSSCWTKANAKKLPPGVYTCDSLKPARAQNQSLPNPTKPMAKKAQLTASLTTTDQLVAAVNNIVNQVVSSSIGKFCAFPDCCHQDSCKQQMKCVTDAVAHSATAQVSGVDDLANAAKACGGEDTMVASAKKQALQMVEQIAGSKGCIGPDCAQTEKCVQDQGSSAIMFLLITHAQHNDGIKITRDLDRDIQSCTQLLETEERLAEGPIFSLVQSMQHVTDKHPQVAMGFGTVMLLGFATIIFAVVYTHERKKRRQRAMANRPPPVQIW